MSAPAIACVVTGSDHAGADPESICAVFAEAVAETGRSDIEGIEIDASSPQSARVVALDETGSELLALDFDVMDTRLSLEVWRRFARSFAGQLGAG